MLRLFFICIFCILGQIMCFETLITTRYDVPYYRPVYFYNPRVTPLALMVDTTNQLGFNLLAYHSIGHSENIAFSPCGLGSVLVALYEGTNGQSSFEIYKAMNLPENRQIIRVGYRDIHRRLRTYFYQQENLLSGLTLNRENIVIKSDYELILRFYGYDLDTGIIVSKYPNGSNFTTDAPMEKEAKSTEGTKERENPSSSSTPTTESTTKMSNDVEKVSAEEITSTLPPTTKPITMTTVISEPVPVTTQKAEDEMQTTMFIATDFETMPPPSTTESSAQTTLVTIEEKPEMTEPTTNIDSTIPTSTESFSSTSSAKPNSQIRGLPPLITRIPISAITQPDTITRFTPLSADEPNPTTLSPTRNPSTLNTTTVRPPRTTMYLFTFKPILNTTPQPNSETNTTRNARANRNLKRSKKRQVIAEYGDQSIYDPATGDAADYLQYNLPNYGPQLPDYYYLQGNPNFVPKDFAVSDIDHQDEINHIFYLDPSKSIQTIFKVYNTILRFAYIESIKSSILEVPLDSDNYNLLLILPDGPYGLDRLVERMASLEAPSMREIRSKLKPHWIKAMVPKFNLKGNAFLTPALMKMGIESIFDPTRADFSPMTDERDIYAKHIEQSITLNIKTPSNNNLRRFAELYYNPIQVSVNQPFLYCIIDTELELTIMIGRIINPLNSRIM